MNHKYQKCLQLIIFMGVAIFTLSFQSALASEVTGENVVDLVNYSRAKNGLGVLVENSKLNEAAMEKANDMFQNNYFAHISPQDIAPWAWFEKVKYDYQYAGENLAINFKTAEAQHEAWMESIDHKKNILNPKYQEIGVAVQGGTIDGKEALVTVQLFGAREDFQVVLGKLTQEDSPDFLNNDPGASSWEQLAFVQESDHGMTDLKKDADSRYSFFKLASANAERLINIFQASGVIVLMSIMAINPILLAGMFFRGRKKMEETGNVAYPVKIVLVK